MNIEIETIKENDDGSIDVSLNLDGEAKDFLIRKAFNDCIKEAIELGKTLTPRETDEH